ncbi:hypothetical protein HDV00_007238 [Rhizophlyctis rosea]|nr:hypothetical protein HDV00_007238 [Rhizophlyctis rosea]
MSDFSPPAYNDIDLPASNADTGTLNARTGEASFFPWRRNPSAGLKSVRLIPVTNQASTRLTYISIDHIVLIATGDAPIVLLNTALATQQGHLRLAYPTTLNDVLSLSRPGEFIPLKDSSQTCVAIVRPESVVEVSAGTVRGTLIGVKAAVPDSTSLMHDYPNALRTTLVRVSTLDVYDVVETLTAGVATSE